MASVDPGNLIDVINGELTVAPTGADGTVQDTFCTIWPQAKPLLQLASGVLMWFPMPVNAAGILNGAIAVLDQLYAQGCTPVTTTEK